MDKSSNHGIKKKLKDRGHILKLLLLQTLCPDGEIGRHASLRGWCLQGRASSSLVLGTNEFKVTDSKFLTLILNI